MSKDKHLVCRDAGEAPGCLGTADPEYTMDFTDVKPGAFIHWCSVCGPRARAIDRALTNKLQNEPGFAEKFKAAIDKHQPS